jgi:predicted aspartyl protease
MPIKDYPLSTTIINPDTEKRIRVYALIDTGADECAFPASFAPLLGHNLQAGQWKRISTGNGITTAYSHTTRIIIEGFSTQEVLVDFMANLNIPLLGVRSFLANFVLIIDYSKKVFSLALPDK